MSLPTLSGQRENDTSIFQVIPRSWSIPENIVFLFHVSQYAVNCWFQGRVIISAKLICSFEVVDISEQALLMHS